MDTYTRNADGTFTVGYITVLTEEQAKALLVETGVFDARKWPFADRRAAVRSSTVTCEHVNGKLQTLTQFEVSK